MPMDIGLLLPASVRPASQSEIQGMRAEMDANIDVLDQRRRSRATADETERFVQKHEPDVMPGLRQHVIRQAKCISAHWSAGSSGRAPRSRLHLGSRDGLALVVRRERDAKQNALWFANIFNAETNAVAAGTVDTMVALDANAEHLQGSDGGWAEGLDTLHSTRDEITPKNRSRTPLRCSRGSRTMSTLSGDEGLSARGLAVLSPERPGRDRCVSVSSSDSPEIIRGRGKM